MRVFLKSVLWFFLFVGCLFAGLGYVGPASAQRSPGPRAEPSAALIKRQIAQDRRRIAVLAARKAPSPKKLPGLIDSLRLLLRKPKLADSTRLDALRQLATYLAKTSDTSAVTVARRAAALALKQGEYVTAARRMLQASMYAERFGQYVVAQDYLYKGLAHAKTHKLPFAWMFYDFLGILAANTSNFEAMVNHFRQARRELMRSGEKEEAHGLLLLNLGNAFMATDQYDSALYYTRKAARYLAAQGSHESIKALSIEAEINLHSQPHTEVKLDSAIAQKKRVLQVYRKMGDAGMAAAAVNGLARAYRIRGNAAEALKAAELGMQLARDTKDVIHTQEALENLAWAHAGLGHHALAYDYNYRLTRYRDSLFNAKKVADIADLQVRYDMQGQQQRLQLLANRNRLAEATSQAAQARVALLTQQNRAAEAQQLAQRAKLGLLAAQSRAAEARTQTQTAHVQLLTQEKLASQRAAQLQQKNQQARLRSLVAWLCVRGLCLLAGLLLYWRLRRQSALLARANEMNRQSAAEKEVLLQEIHHRVKNNLEIVNSLLSWQSSTLPEPALIEVLRSSQSRIHSMALVHEFLYRADDLSQVRLDEYLARLLAELHQTLTAPTQNISVSTDLSPLVMEAKVAFNFGLLVNELITNTLKHAFRGRTNGHLHVELTGSASHFRLLVADDGVGMPDAQTVQANPASLGTKLIGTLAKQLKAILTIEPNLPSGTRIVIAQA